MRNFENNKLIAEFMGAVKSDFGNYMIFTVKNPQSVVKIYHSEIKYDSSWDWLIPVVEKIDSMGHHFHLYSDSAEIDLCGKERLQFRASKLTKIEACYDVVIQFINWYNK